jgi:hypothetical protein
MITPRAIPGATRQPKRKTAASPMPDEGQTGVIPPGREINRKTN